MKVSKAATTWIDYHRAHSKKKIGFDPTIRICFYRLAYNRRVLLIRASTGILKNALELLPNGTILRI